MNRRKKISTEVIRVLKLFRAKYEYHERAFVDVIFIKGDYFIEIYEEHIYIVLPTKHNQKNMCFNYINDDLNEFYNCIALIGYLGKRDWEK